MPRTFLGDAWHPPADGKGVDIPMVARLGGIIAAGITVLVVLAAFDAEAGGETPWLLGAGGFAGGAAIVHLRWGHRLPVWVLDAFAVGAQTVLCALMVHGGVLRPALPVIYLMIGTIQMAMRGRWVAMAHIVALSASFGIGLAFGPDVPEPAVHLVALVAAVVVCGTFVRMLMSAFVALTLSEHEARAEAERTAVELAEVDAVRSRFLARMCHELRTPLNAIIGFADVLRHGYAGELSSQQVDYVGDIAESGRHLGQLVDDVLDLPQVELGRLELTATPEDLAEVVRSCLSIVRSTALRHGVELREHLTSDVVLEIDGRRIRQVVLNLLANAIRFSESGGRVTVSVSVLGDRARVAVSDTGPGVAAEDVERIFLPFGQADGVSDGTGLGLPLARRFVEAHGGRLWVEQHSGPGATFAFDLPMDAPVMVVEHEPEGAASLDELAYEALNEPGSAASCTMITGWGAWFGACAAAFGLVLAVLAPGDLASRLVLVAFALVAGASTLVLDRLAGSIGAVGVDLLGAFGVVCVSVIAFLHPMHADVAILAYAAIPLAGGAMWPLWNTVAKHVLIAVGYGVVVVAAPIPNGWIHWVAAMVLVNVTGIVARTLTAGFRRVLDDERRARARAEALRSRLDELGRHKNEFRAAMSHELRAPLNAIIGFADVLAAGYAGALDERQSGYVADIGAAGRQLLGLIDDVLALVKLEARGFDIVEEQVCLRDLVDHAVTRVDDQVRDRTIAVTIAGPTRAQLSGDARWLSLAVDKLVANAVKFTPDGGHVRIEVASGASGHELAVSDDGIGIAEHQLPRIFDPFHQGDVVVEHAQGGAGVGLALVKGVVDLHGGEVRVESEVGRGSTFTLCLPRWPQARLTSVMDRAS